MSNVSGKRSKIPGDVEDLIIELALKGWSAGQIHEALERDPNTAGRAPSRRTIERKVKEHRSDDSSGTWSLVTTTPDDAALILPVLAAIIRGTKGKVTTLTNAEAKEIVTILTACPSIDPLRAFLYARLYLARAKNNASTVDIDAYLAFMPWVDDAKHQAWAAACKAGWIQSPPLMFLVDDSGNVAPMDDMEKVARGLAQLGGTVTTDKDREEGQS
jgi:hypothetical protein